MRPTIEAIPVRRPRPTRRRPQHLCLDKGFDYDEPRALAQEFGFRSILIRWAKKPSNYLALLHFALAIITWRHALPG